VPEFKLKITIDGRQAAIMVVSADTKEEAMRNIRERIDISVVGQEPRGSRRVRSRRSLREWADDIMNAAKEIKSKQEELGQKAWNIIMPSLKEIVIAAQAIQYDLFSESLRNASLREVKSQEVADVVSDPGFQELVAPVSEGIVQQMGEVVMRTVDQIAGPIEEVLDRPLAEEELPDVHEVATDMVQESLSQVSRGIAETAPAPGVEARRRARWARG
jgi:hypothetical protein